MPDLAEYRAKRDFSRTAEPAGQAPVKAAATGGIFVVQKHAASRLHYDFRLEHDGVLWSWAVTRGPSLDPAEKRLAVHVEDHPLDYAGFEGTIPEGAYGGGAVIVWDEGRWQPEGDPAQALKEGRLSFRLEGRKLNGGWHLVRMRARERETRENWLLIKDDDSFARREGDILEKEPNSVKSGRSVEEVGGKPSSPGPRKAHAAKRKAEKAPAPEKRPPARGAARGRSDGATLTHPEKLLWPEAGVSKRDLLDHYEKAWERMAPFLVDRPLTLVRAPDGRKRFFQQHAWAGMPDAVHRMRDPADDAELLFVTDFSGLAALVQFGTVEIHGWGAKTDALTLPDQVVFDLDPDEGVAAEAVRRAALEVRARLEDAGLTPFVKTSGGKGFHVAAPLKPKAGWEEVAGFAGRLVQAMASGAPDRFTTSSAKAGRKGRIYLDTLRNNPNATTVVPWSSRAREAATVSVPITWDALEKGAGPADFTLGGETLEQALRTKDPWKRFRDDAFDGEFQGVDP